MEEKGETNKLILDVELHGLKPGEEKPKIVMYLLDATGTIQEKVACVVEGKLTLDPALAEERQKILALGPEVKDLKELRRDMLLQFRIGEQWPIWESIKVIEIPRDWWFDWPLFKTCVSGRVRRCWPIFKPLLPRPELGGIQIPIHPTIPFPWSQRCSPICNGVVEVYERECCCPPWIIPDISDILRKLKELVEVWPPHVFPPPPPPPPDKIGPIGPRPGPDPSPIDRTVLRSLKRNESFGIKPLIAEMPEHLSQDIKALETMPQAEAIKYVWERPHLWHFCCTCSERKLGETTLGPDGHFTFCYTRFPRLFRRHCRRSYFYKVKQWQENQWVYIYDGSASHQYFTADQFADLKTWKGRACAGDDPDVPYERPFVMLQDIGSTHSWRLVSHWLGKDVAGNDLTQIDDNSVAMPPANGGLANPPGPGGATLMQLVNQPWGEMLWFRLYFHPGMKALGARYYRISIVPAGPNGNPTPGSTPTYLTNPISWLKFVYVGGQVQVLGEGLGPNPVGGNVGLYRIPYREDALWLEGQHHQVWDTRLQANGKYLLAIEIFDAAGNRLTPGVANGTDIHKDFDYLRWLEETGPDSVSRVTFAKLQHLFWINNLPVYADIVDLRKDGVASGDECQFMTGPEDSTLSAGFRAFHSTLNSGAPPETFMYYYTMWWHRGLNGPNGTIETGGANRPSNSLADPPAVSATQTFAQMLGTNTVGAKCTFAVNLRVYAKHTNGSRRLLEYDREDQAAFALEITS
ncbi:MAG: hypothetical protein HZC12_06610 [Nitrospirae bacterium]|nr:hypothetical protein [Nitrospirota bacterium]